MYGAEWKVASVRIGVFFEEEQVEPVKEEIIRMIPIVTFEGLLNN